MNSRILRIALPAVLVLALAGWAGYQYFIVADSPDEVTTEAALEQLSEDLAAEDEVEVSADPDADEAAAGDAEPDPAEESDTAEPTATGVVGTWTVDDDFGEFAFENASGSFAGFRVDKELFVGGVQVAVGRSGDVSGTITIGDGQVDGGEIVVVTTSLESDIPARTGAVLDAVEADEFETATFAITTPATLDTVALDAGETVAASIVGDLTIAGVTNPVTVAAEATVAEPGLALIIGTADLTWADFGVETPSSSVGDVADEGILEFQLVVRFG